MNCPATANPRESLPDRLYRLGKLTRDQHIACAEIRRCFQYPNWPNSFVEWQVDEIEVPVVGAIKTSRRNLVIGILVIGSGLRETEGMYRLRHGAALEHLKDSLDAYIAKEVEISNRLAKMEKAAHDSLIVPLMKGEAPE